MDNKACTSQVPDNAALADALTLLGNDVAAWVPDVLAGRVDEVRLNLLADTMDTLAWQLRSLVSPSQDPGIDEDIHWYDL